MTLSLSSLMSLILGSSFLVGSFEIKLALVAYVSVLRFSSKNESEGERQAIIRQKELPPKLYFKRQVSLESLYGIC